MILSIADVATGTLYFYIKSKEDIEEGWVNHYMIKSSGKFIPVLSNPDIAMAIDDTVHESLKHTDLVPKYKAVVLIFYSISKSIVH
jgi:hypothetical protein